MWTPAVEFIDAEIVLPPPVKKQVWDGEKFVPITIYKIKELPVIEAEYWLKKTFGSPRTYRNGSYWDYSRAGDFTVMDEKVYMFYKPKWEGR